MREPQTFPYDLAFDRNLGWLTDWEQLALRAKRVAIAGMGGVGGVYLLTLARLGIGGFTIADFDSFEFANFNRQVGALVGTVGRPKAEVLEEMARAINPELRIRRFDSGVAPESVDDFLDGADLFVDGLDFFEIPIRRRIFARCRERGIPAITAAPIGMGVGYLIFTPTGMSFERYFRFEGRPPEEQFLRFLMGLVPRALHRRYLVDPGRINLAARKGPSTAAAVQLCAGVTAAAAVKLLLGRGGVKAAPWQHHFDAYRDRLAVSRLRFGHGGPLQRVKLALARRMIQRSGRRAAAPDPPAHGRTPIEEILNLARWAPSGDNTQPWRFRVIDDVTVAVRVRAEPDNIYEYRQGEPTVLSAGMLVEAVRLAAGLWGRGMRWEGTWGAQEHRLTVHVPPEEGEADALAPWLTLRSVDRRRFRARRLSEREKAALTEAAGGRVRLDWHESAAARWRLARLNGRATDIRLRCPEAFAVHQRVIDWERALSPAAIPAGAIGLAPAGLPLLRWALRDWGRMRRLNRLVGTAGTALQLDYVPGLACAGFVVFRLPAPTAGAERFAALIEAGRGILRFWLAATRLGLAVQPTLAMLAFAEYGEAQTPFTTERPLLGRARALAAGFRTAVGAPEEVVFVARVGEKLPRMPNCRSSRLPLEVLMEEGGDGT